MRSIKLPSWISRALGVGARSTPPHVFALDQDGLAYARFSSAGEGGAMVIEEARLWDVPNEIFGKGPLGGPVRDQAALEAFIGEAVTSLSESVAQASLVLPDEWSRVVFVELAELPRAERARDEVLRWKLKQQVPFRVEDLRVRGVAVRSLEGQEEPQRMLVTFGSEHLLGGLEGAFQRAGVRIGHIGNRSMAFAEGVSSLDGGEAFLWGGANGYSLVVLDHGEPVLFRSKNLEPGLLDEVVAGMVERELRLTLGFLAKKSPDVALERVVVADGDQRSVWVEAALRGVGGAPRLGGEAGPGSVPEVAAAGHAVTGRFDLSSGQSHSDALPMQWLPLFGAAQRAVA